MKPMIYHIQDHSCYCTDEYIRIDNSYNVKNKEIMSFLSDLMSQFARDGRLTHKRTFESWETEWVAHNRLYKLGLFRNHTKDVDLYEDESKIRLFFYTIIGFHIW